MLVDPHAIELRCPVQDWVLPHIRCLVTSVATAMGFSEDDVQKIELSVDEACANAILHAYDESERLMSTILVRLKQVPYGLQVDVIDNGRGSINGHCHAGVHSIGEYVSAEQHNGLGTYIMNKLMDEVQFWCPPEKGTVVTLIKRLSA